MHSELRPTLLATPQFWDIQDAGWPTGNDTSGHVEVPLGSHSAPSEACSVAAKLSLCPLPGFTPGLARDRGIFTKQDASSASLICVMERRGPLSRTVVHRGEGHFVNLMFSPAVSSVFCFFVFPKYISDSNYFSTPHCLAWTMEINSRIHLANSMPALTLSHDSGSTQGPQLSLHDVFTKSRLPDPPSGTPHLSWVPTVSPGTSKRSG